LSFRDSGRAILFVSHNLSAVEMMCPRTIWLDHGVIRQVGPTAEVIRAYIDAVDEALIGETARPGGSTLDQTDAIAVVGATLHDKNRRATSDFDYGDVLRVGLSCVARRDVEYVQCSLTIRGDYGPLFTATSDTFDCWRSGPHDLECVFESLPLLPGLYRVEVQVRHAATLALPLPRTIAAFRVTTDLSAFGSDSLVGATKSRGGFLAVAYDWRVQTSAGEQVLAGLRRPTIMAPSRRR